MANAKRSPEGWHLVGDGNLIDDELANCQEVVARGLASRLRLKQDYGDPIHLNNGTSPEGWHLVGDGNHAETGIIAALRQGRQRAGISFEIETRPHRC